MDGALSDRSPKENIEFELQILFQLCQKFRHIEPIVHMPLEMAFALATQHERNCQKQHEKNMPNASSKGRGPNATYIPPVALGLMLGPWGLAFGPWGLVLGPPGFSDTNICWYR